MNRASSPFVPSGFIWFRVALWVMSVLVITVGCGGRTCSVRGTVRYLEKPLEGGSINFFPENGRPLGGAVKSDGTYEFQLPPGEYKVIVKAAAELPDGWKEGDPVPSGPTLPTKYSRPSTSGLAATVADGSGTLVFDFDLK